MLKLALTIQFVSNPMRTLLIALMMTLATQAGAENQEGKGNAAEKAIKEWKLNGGLERQNR